MNVLDYYCHYIILMYIVKSEKGKFFVSNYYYVSLYKQLLKRQLITKQSHNAKKMM
jgi:hypothetical protein